MVKKRVIPETGQERGTEGETPEIVQHASQGHRPLFWTTQKILVGATGGACLVLLLISLLVWGTTKPADQPSVSVIPSLLARLSDLERAVSRQAEGRPSAGSPILWITFSLLRQDVFAGLSTTEGVARLRAVLTDLQLQRLEEQLTTLSQGRIWSLGELVLKFDPATFFPRQEKKVSLLGKSLAFLEKFFKVWKTTPTQAKKANGEEFVRAFCAQVQAGDIKSAVHSAEELASLPEAEGKIWLQEAQRFVRAQEILAELENAVLVASP